MFDQWMLNKKLDEVIRAQKSESMSSLLNFHIDVEQWNRIEQTLEIIKQGVINLSKQSDAASAAFKSFVTAFAAFVTDATKTLNDIAARPAGDPADASALTDIATGLGITSVTLADLDAKIKAADPGPATGTPLSITGPTTLPQGVAGQVYAPVTFTTVGGAGSNVFSSTGLPDGLALSPGGVLTGTPLTAGSSNVVVTVVDSAGTKASLSVSLSVAGAVAPSP